MKEWTRWTVRWKHAARSRTVAATADAGRRDSAAATKGSTNHAAAVDAARQRNARWRRRDLPPPLLAAAAGGGGGGCVAGGWVPAGERGSRVGASWSRIVADAGGGFDVTALENVWIVPSSADGLRLATAL